MNKDFSTTSPSREDTNPSIVKPGISLFGIDLPQEHRIPLIVIGSILLFSMLVVASVGSVALYRLYQSKDSVSKTDENTQDKKDENTPPKPPNNNNLVEIQGGEFSMGTDDINQDDEYEFLQYPAHKVIVDSFLIDRTEVTNEEYAKFIAETNYKPPKDWNGNNYPPAGKEKFPVVNVSIEDADKFAKWRSERDGLQCRLPEEKEWEYAARSANNYIYPWGNGWKDDMGNVGPNTSLKPVGSYPNSGTAVGGVQDMMGNAYEWTSSKASLYENNTIAKKKGRENIEKEKNQNVYRSFGLGTNLNYKSKFLTLRAWFSPDTKKDVLGFRLVCKK
jgi:formylglycine-generating enzyme required for sulfatase activity